MRKQNLAAQVALLVSFALILSGLTGCVGQRHVAQTPTATKLTVERPRPGEDPVAYNERTQKRMAAYSAALAECGRLEGQIVYGHGATSTAISAGTTGALQLASQLGGGVLAGVSAGLAPAAMALMNHSAATTGRSAENAYMRCKEAADRKYSR